VQHLLHEPRTPWCPTVEARDRRRNGGFIDEYELSRIKQHLPPPQCLTRGGDVWPVLLGGPQAFFLKDNFK
jgi:hypothetical protein